MHPHDNLKLTIGNFIKIFGQTIENQLPASEKLDGFNIHILKVNGEIRFARNAGDLAKGGFGKNEIENRFSNDRVREVFRMGFEMAEKDARFKNLPEWELFHYTMNTEIITGRTNIMPYGDNLLVPHNLFRWHDNGDSKFVVAAVDEIPGGLRTVLPFTWMPVESDYNENYWHDRVWKVFEEFTEDNTLEEYYGHKFVQVVMAIMEGEYEYELIRAMFNRFFGIGEKVNLRELRKQFGSENVQKFLDIEKQLVFLTKDDLDQLVLEMGTYILNHFRGLNWASGAPYQAMQILHEEVLKTLNDSTDGSPVFIHRWMACKGQIFATEGLVVEFNGDRYKWTGPFAPINQLLGGNR